MSSYVHFIDAAAREEWAVAGFRRCGDFLSNTRGTVVSTSRSSTTRRIDLDGKSSFLKAYPSSGVASFLRGAKAEVEARNYEILQNLGFRVPETLAYGARRSAGCVTGSFVLTAAVPNSTSLEKFALQRVSREIRRRLLTQSALLVRHLHVSAFFHVDLQWRNILVSQADSDSPPLFLLDAARGGLRRWNWRREHGRLRDLSSLYKDARQHLSHREIVRWLHEYFAVGKLSPLHRVIMDTVTRDRASKNNEGRH